MVSMQVALLQDPVTKAEMQAGGTKKVCNAKVAGGEQLECGVMASEDMAWASKSGVFRLGLDWMMLIPDGPGKFKLTPGSGSSVLLATWQKKSVRSWL